MNDQKFTVPGPTVESTRQLLDVQIAKLFFQLGCGMSLIGVLVYGGLALQLQPGMRLLTVIACLLLAVAYGCALWFLNRAPLSRVAQGIGWSGMLAMTLVAVGVGEGVHSLSLGFMGLLVCLVTVLASVPAGIALAVGCAAAVTGLHLLEATGGLPGDYAQHRHSNFLNVAIHVMLLMTAVAAGTQMSRMLNRAMREAAEREQRFRSLLSIAADWYWELDADLRFSHIANPVVSQAQVHPIDERLGQRPWEISELDIDPVASQLHRADLEAHRPFADLPVRFTTESGRTLHYSMTGRPRFDDDGKFTGYWGVGRDITPEVHAREAHSASESRYRELFALSATPLVLHRNGVVILANEAAAQLFGFASGDAMNGFHLLELYPREHRVAVAERIRNATLQPIGESLDMIELPMNAVDGRRITVQASSAHVHTSDGSASLSRYHDVTERVATESALRRSQAMLSHLFATSPDFISLSDVDSGTYLMVNESFTRTFGYTAEETVGRTTHDLGLWASKSDRDRMVANLRAQGGVSETETLFVHKSGRIGAVMMSAGRFFMDGRDYVVVNGRDVSESQRARLEHEAILKHASIGIALTREKRFTQTNPAFERMFGWGPGELIGQPGSVVWPEDDFVELRRTIEPLLSQGKPVELERQVRRRDGSLFWCRALAQVVDPSHPSQGGTIWIAEDVTERRQVDQALAAARDVAEAANRAKSTFLANTSHEIRTPLNGLLGLAKLAMQPALEAKRRQQYLEQILDSAQSLAGIISDILDVSKIEAGKLSIEAVPFNLHGLLSAVHHAYHSLAQARSLALDLHVADDVPSTVRGDPVRLRQILSNYITNGLKFTASGGLRLDVSMSRQPDHTSYVRFTVSDTGPGVDPATQERLFQPFTQADESTTRRFGGTGLGLSICKDLAELMGGSVGMKSLPGLGSQFWADVPLPPTDEPVIDPNEEAIDIERLAGMRVLLVEDNPVNMMVGAAMLEQWGVHVTQAVDGQDALAAVERAAATGRLFDLVLMDVQMPRLSGHEAARRLRMLYTADELPIVALTAAALVSEREDALAAGMNDFLTKPIDAHRLRKVLTSIERRVF